MDIRYATVGLPGGLVFAHGDRYDCVTLSKALVRCHRRQEIECKKRVSMMSSGDVFSVVDDGD